MRLAFTLNDESRNARILNWWVGWFNYHITKHVIQGRDDEQFGKILNIEKDKFAFIEKKQKNEYQCTVPQVIEGIYPCEKCEMISQCTSLLEDIKTRYKDIIKEVLINDKLNPRNATYFDSKKKQHSVVFIDARGVNVIGTIRQNDNVDINSCYRASLNDLDEFKRPLLKLTNDTSWYLNRSIKNWRMKLDKNKDGNKRYKLEKYHLKDNWRWA